MEGHPGTDLAPRPLTQAELDAMHQQGGLPAVPGAEPVPGQEVVPFDGQTDQQDQQPGTTVTPYEGTAETPDDKPGHHNGADTSEDEEDLVVGLAGTGHDARLYSRDAAHESQLTYLEEKTGVRRIARKVWSNVSSGARKERYAVKHRQEIETNTHHNVLMHHGVSDEEWGDMARDTITRFTGEYDDLLDKAAGERKAEISDAEDPHAVALKSAMKGLIKDYAEGRLDDDSFGEEKNRVLGELAKQGMTKDLLGEGGTFADNLHDIAKSVVRRIGNERSAVSADEVIDKLKFVVGEARVGSRTEAKKNVVERLSDKLNCKWINETTAVAAASTVYAIGRWSTQRASSAALRFGFVGVGSGLWAGIRARSESKSERNLIARERAMGIERDKPANKLETKLNETLHDSKNARDIIGDLSSLFDEEGKLSVESPDHIRDVTALLADVRARQLLSGRNKVDLIDYSSAKTSAAERLQLMRLTAQLETQLAGKFGTLSEADRRGLSETGRFDGLLTASKDAAVGTLSESIDEKDKLAQRLHNKEFMKGFVKGTVLGMAMGEIAQEATAFIRPGEQGAVEGLFHHDKAATSGTLAAGFFGEAHEHAANMFSGDTKSDALFNGHDGAKTDMTLPKEFNVQKGAHGFTITGPDGKSVSGISVDAHGQLTPQSLQEMKSIGLDPVGAHPNYTPIEHVSTSSTTVSADEFLHNHSAETTHVSRVDWAANGTNTPDGNELSLDLGAPNGVDANNDVVLSMKGMVDGKSVTWSGDSISPQDALQQGKLSAYISLDRGSQTVPFKVPIRPDGTIVIGHDSPLRQLFNEKGQDFNFKGGFIEVAQNDGQSASGAEQITPLATVVGNNNVGNLHDIVQTKTTVPHYSYSFQPEPAPAPKDLPVDVPPVLPFYYRNTLRPRAEDRVLGEDEPLPGNPSRREQVDERESVPSMSREPAPYRWAAEPRQSRDRTPGELEGRVPEEDRRTLEAETERLAIEAAQSEAPRPDPNRLAIEGRPAEEEQPTEEPTERSRTRNRTRTQETGDEKRGSSNDNQAADDNAAAASDVADEGPEWEEGDQELNNFQLAGKYGFQFMDYLPASTTRHYSTSVWRNATRLINEAMQGTNTGDGANTRLLRNAITNIGQGNAGTNQAQTPLESATQDLLTYVLQEYRAAVRARRRNPPAAAA